ncbi:hypothetical protein ColLi_10012 [Colletotrichum liriopes]|uniref:Uncharacterized protein n=1 Tax=Colletotrichum liriopes TaxID=708192 RepID=A0AA37LWA2_9PEZI|nr:hypothetical protein ColLi_10012 [Colletotrichum liriopes]
MCTGSQFPINWECTSDFCCRTLSIRELSRYQTVSEFRVFVAGKDRSIRANLCEIRNKRSFELNPAFRKIRFPFHEKPKYGQTYTGAKQRGCDVE